jgi:hypothetical protein
MRETGIWHLEACGHVCRSEEEGAHQPCGAKQLVISEIGEEARLVARSNFRLTSQRRLAKLWELGFDLFRTKMVLVGRVQGPTLHKEEQGGRL